MAFMRDMKQTITNGANDLVKLTKLTAEDVREEIKHEFRQDEITQTSDELHSDFEHLKETVKNVLK